MLQINDMQVKVVDFLTIRISFELPEEKIVYLSDHSIFSTD